MLYNESSCCGMISKHMYPLVLPLMAPFCMEITKKKLTPAAAPDPITYTSTLYALVCKSIIITWKNLPCTIVMGNHLIMQRYMR